MWLNCKVIKKWQPPHFYINPPFQIYPPFLAKNFVPPQVTQFLEGPTRPHPSFHKGGGGSNYGNTNIHNWLDPLVHVTEENQ